MSTVDQLICDVTWYLLPVYEPIACESNDEKRKCMGELGNNVVQVTFTTHVK